jgi:lysophospholipase L1-like esterase
MGSRRALGHGYVAEVSRRLGAAGGAHPIDCVNVGTSGETVRDLASRWDRDVLDLKPDWLSIMIGINDVWRHFDGVDLSAAVGIEEYERTYSGLVGRTAGRVSGIVLMTPYYLEGNLADPMRSMMDAYRAAVCRLAGRHGALLVDTQGAFDSALEGRPHTVLAGDRVHPTDEGHAVLATAFLEAVGA